MTKHSTSRAVVPSSFFAGLLLPFAIPMLLTAALVIFVGAGWPRNIAPGSGLKLAGLCVTVLTSLAVWMLITRHIGDRRARKAAALICGAVGLLGWPVWSVGVLPSVNGFSLGPQQSHRMVLDRVEVTTVSRSSARNHWAWLRPDSPDALAGRYFIPEAIYAQWSRKQPAVVTVTMAPGLLGAQVVTGYE